MPASSAWSTSQLSLSHSLAFSLSLALSLSLACSLSLSFSLSLSLLLALSLSHSLSLACSLSLSLACSLSFFLSLSPPPLSSSSLSWPVCNCKRITGFLLSNPKTNKFKIHCSPSCQLSLSPAAKQMPYRGPRSSLCLPLAVVCGHGSSAGKYTAQRWPPRWEVG